MEEHWAVLTLTEFCSSLVVAEEQKKLCMQMQIPSLGWIRVVDLRFFFSLIARLMFSECPQCK